MCENTHLCSSRNSFSSDCSSSFFSFLYSNSAASEYCSRIHSCMNHLTSHAALSESSISFLMSNCPVYGFHRAAQHLTNLLQCAMTCSAVFLTWSHEQISDRKPDMWILFRKAASSMQFVQIYVIIEFSVFCSCTWNLTALCLKNSTSRKFHFKDLSV